MRADRRATWSAWSALGYHLIFVKNVDAPRWAQVKLCVVTVPAPFTEAQRDAMKRACGYRNQNHEPCT